MSYNRGIFIRRNTKPKIGSRQSGSQRARTQGLTKERANKPNILRLQGCFEGFLDFVSVVSSRSQRDKAVRRSVYSCQDGQPPDAVVAIGVQECVVIPERYAAVGITSRTEHEGMREQTCASVN